MSLASFDARCSLQTWGYRIAHNVGASHVPRSRRLKSRLVDLETLEVEGFPAAAQAARELSVGALLDLIFHLKPLDRQIMLLYLEGSRRKKLRK
jgi:RNA polymerase sigma-70 factor (ECF subfamily)